MAEVETIESTDVTDQLSLSEIKKRTVKGVAVLTGRTFLMQVIGLVSTFFLTVFLSPHEYGTFFLVSAAINFFAYFSDIGLAGALIQKKDKLTDLELKTTFTVQQILVIGLIAIIFLTTPLFEQWIKISKEATFLLWALAFNLLTSSLKSIPSVLLERRLDFNRLVVPQIVETILFNLVAVLLAWQNFGIMSFVVAVIIRAVAGLVLIYILNPWIPGFAFSKAAIKPLFKYGLPYQTNAFLSVIKDDGMTVILGGILGPSGIGLLGWAQKWAFAPLRFFMDQVIKVTFPAFSRMQDDKKELSKAVSKSIYFICILVFPSLVLLVTLAPILADLIPKYEKWKPALMALTFISINCALAAITTPLTNMLNAIGKINLTFKLMIMWTVLTWVLVPILSIKFGINGAGLGYMLVGLSSIVAIRIATRSIDLNFWQVIGKPALAAVILGAVILGCRNLIQPSLFWVVILLCAGLALYILLLILFIGKELIIDTKKILLSFSIFKK